MNHSVPKTRKVLHIVHGFGAGGAETWLLAVVRHLNAHPELGWHFDFLATGGEVNLLDNEIKNQGCNIYYKKYSFRSFFTFRRYFRNLLKSNNYYAIHDHQDFVSGWHFLLGVGNLPKVRVTHLHNPYNFVHNYVTSPSRWFSFKVGRILTALFASKITGTSNAVMNEYGYGKWPFAKKRTFPAYCGFDIGKFQFNADGKAVVCKAFGWEKDCRIALFVGRIGLQSYDTAKNQKNPLFAFQIAVDLVEQYPNWKFIFVGYKGKFGDDLEAEVTKMGLSDCVIFTGLREDVPVLMSASNVLVFPSLWEGLGMVAVEAQASGLPVVMSDTIPGEAIVCREIVATKSLELGRAEWIKEIIEMGDLQANRLDFASKVADSPFSIESSVRGLVGLYLSI